MTASLQGADDRTNLFGMDRSQLARFLERFDAPGFHAGQIYRWLYARHSLEIEGWTDLSVALRSGLATAAVVDAGRVVDRAEASDGTIKYRVHFSGGDVECVSMVHSSRFTLCISSQVGCALDCDFCLTGKMGFVRHLTPGEIVAQVRWMAAERDLGERAFNLVFMGMGEPLHNYDGVIAAIRLLTDDDGFGLSRRRITVSTSGLAPAIERLASEPIRPRLAVSLNATTDAVRDRLMPINRKYDIERLLEACRCWTETTGERFTFEYVLLDGINDADADEQRLARIVRRTPAKVNLIPFNPVPGLLAYRPPQRERVLRFRDGLLAKGVPASVRWSRGAEARAACGQLALLER